MDVLLAAIQRSTRAIALLGAGLIGLALFLQWTGAARGLHVWGLFPLHGFMIALGLLVPIITYARAAEFRALQFTLVGAGVRTRDAMIPWDEIVEIYRGGAVHVAHGILRAGEVRLLRIVARDGREIRLELRLFGRVSKDVSRALTTITETLLRHVDERQRRELDARLAAGERVRFSDALWIGADGVSRSREDREPIPRASVRGIECVDGRLQLRHQDAGGRVRTRSLGEVEETANLHLIERALAGPRIAPDPR